MSKTASFPRIVDYWIGGPQNTPVDQAEGDALASTYPTAPTLLKAQRAFQQQAVGALAEEGIAQFLVFNAGFPTANHVHEQLEEVKVYYTDSDFDVVQPGAGLLAGVRRRVRYQTLDPRDLENLEDLELSPVLNTEAPIGVVFIGAGETFSDDDLKLVLGNLATWAKPGSAIVFTHATSEASGLSALFEAHGKPFATRDASALEPLLAGFGIEAGGLSPLKDETGAELNYIVGAVGRKA